MTPGTGSKNQKHYQTGVNTPSTVHMSQYGSNYSADDFNSPSSTIKTPDHIDPIFGGVHHIPKMPNRPTAADSHYYNSGSAGVAAPPTPGSLAEALGMLIDQNRSAPYIRKNGDAPPPLQPYHGTTFGYSTTTGGASSSSRAATSAPPKSVSPRPGSLAEALGMVIDAGPGAPYIRKNGEAPPPIQPYHGTTIGYSTTTGAAAAAASSTSPRPGSLAEALGMVIDAGPGAPYIRKDGEAPPPIQPYYGTTIGYSTTKGGGTLASVAAATSPRPGSLAAALGLMIDANAGAPYIRKNGESPPPIQPYHGTTFGYSTSKGATVPTSVHASSQPRPGSLAAALGMKIDSSYQAAPICEVGHNPPPTQTYRGTTFGYSTTTTTPSKGATSTSFSKTSPRPGSLAAALGFAIDIASDAPYVRKEGESAPPIQPYHGTTFGYSTTRGGGGTAEKTVSGSSPRPGSLAAALGFKIDSAYDAPYVRKEGEAPPAIQPYRGTTFGYSTSTGSSKAPRPGSLAAALGLSIDPNDSAPYIRKEGEAPPAIQPYHGTTFGYSTTGGTNKKSLLDVVLSRVVPMNLSEGRSHATANSARPGSLADALGMKIDSSYQAAPICEVGHAPPPTQTHYGTTFMGNSYNKTSSSTRCKKSLMDAVVTRVRSNSVDSYSEEPNVRTTRASKPKKSLMDAVVTRVRSNSIDSFNEEGMTHHVVNARKGSLADALSMRIDASYEAPAIREKGHHAPPVQSHYGTTFIGGRQQQDHHHHHEQQQQQTSRASYALPEMSYSPPPPVASIWMVADMTMKSRKSKKKKKCTSHYS